MFYLVVCEPLAQVIFFICGGGGQQHTLIPHNFLENHLVMCCKIAFKGHTSQGSVVTVGFLKAKSPGPIPKTRASPEQVPCWWKHCIYLFLFFLIIVSYCKIPETFDIYNYHASFVICHEVKQQQPISPFIFALLHLTQIIFIHLC